MTAGDGDETGKGATRLFDAHCHLDLMSNAAQVARNAAAGGLAFLAVTVEPRGYEAARLTLGELANVHLAAGLHPWWVADGRCGPDDVKRATELAAQTRLIGEVGLDFSPRHVPKGTEATQAVAFRSICQAAARTSDPATPKVLSIHAVRAANNCLDILEETGCLRRCRCVFHWFSGSSDELHRAVQANCWFSVNEMMLRTRRGREYARQLPLAQLLTETDLPPHAGEPFSAIAIQESLERTIGAVAAIRRLDPEELRKTLATNARTLLSSPLS